MKPADQIEEGIAEYIKGYARNPGALQALYQALNAMGAPKLSELAQLMLDMRRLSVLGVMSDQELEALANGSVHLATVVRGELLQLVEATPAQEPAEPDPAVFNTLEAIAQRHLRHTLVVRNHDSQDFFGVHAGCLHDALLAAFTAGLLLRD